MDAFTKQHTPIFAACKKKICRIYLLQKVYQKAIPIK